MSYSSFSSMGRSINTVSSGGGSTPYSTLLISKAPWAIYNASSYNTSTRSLPDLTGNGRHATASAGVTFTSAASGNGASVPISCLTGTTADSLVFPTGSLPTNFTLCSITRMTTLSGPGYQVVITGSGLPGDATFMHGHQNGFRVCYYGDTYKTNATNPTDTNWQVTCGKNGNSTISPTPGNILINGATVGNASGGTGGGILHINSAGKQNYSNWSFSQLIIWNQVLTNNELKIVSDTLNRYLTTGTNT